MPLRWPSCSHWLPSLKLRIAAAALATLALGVGVTAWVLSNHAAADMLAERQAVEHAEAARSARQLDRRVVELQRALQLASGAVAAGRFDDVDAWQAALRSRPLLLGQFDSLFVAGADGVMRLRHERGVWARPGIDIAERGYFQTLASERRPTVSQLLISRVTGEPVVVVAHPVLAGERLLGAIGGTLRVRNRDLLVGIIETIDGRQDNHVLVTDDRGMIIAHRDGTRVGLPLGTEPGLSDAWLRWREMGSPLNPRGLALSDADRIIVAAAATDPQWVVWRSLQRDELLAPILEARRTALVWAAWLSLMLAGLLFGLLWWQFRPLARLQQRAQLMLDPQADPSAGWPVGSDEVGQLAAMLRHVATERAQLEQQNARALRRLTAVMTAAPIGIAFTRRRQFEAVSPEWCRLLGRDESTLVGAATQSVFASNEDHLRLGLLVAAAFACRQLYVGEWPMLRGEGTRFWARLRAQPVDWTDADAGTIWAMDDISEEMAHRDSLEWSATHDALTGLANRKALLQRMDKLLAARPESMPATLLLLDLDRFKPVNDQYGHAAGDAMLKAVAHAAMDGMRGGDLVARLGGDEFAVLLERCSGDVAQRIAEELRAAIAAIRLPWGDATLNVGVSVGLAALTEAMHDHSAWLEAADAACYEAKGAGRDRVRSATIRPLRAVPAAPRLTA